MANKEAGERSLDLGDKRLTLKFSMNAYCELEDILGYGTGELQQLLNQQRWSFSMIRAMIWAGSRKHHRMDAEVRTEQQIGDLMDEAEDFNEVMTTVFDAYQAGQPKASDTPDQDSSEANGSPKAKGKKKPVEAVASSGDS